MERRVRLPGHFPPFPPSPAKVVQREKGPAMRPDLFRSRLDILLTLGNLLLAGCSIAGEQEMAQDQKAAGQAAKPEAEANGVYGAAWGVNSLRNFEVGKTAGRQLAYRFRAATSSVPESVRFY